MLCLIHDARRVCAEHQEDPTLRTGQAIERDVLLGHQAVFAFTSVGEPIPWAKSASAPFATDDPQADKDSAIGSKTVHP